MENIFVFDAINDPASNKFFKLHAHDAYEIYLFLEGDTQYIVEGNAYNVQPYDLIITRKNQLHRVWHNSEVKYRRFVINVHPDFFVENNCAMYEEPFLNIDKGNKIDGKLVLSSGIYDAFMRFRKYLSQTPDFNSPIAISSVTEILHLINNIKAFSDAENENPNLSKVLDYINSNYTQDITLDMLESSFSISKYHLCRIFHKRTGMTIHQYITKKRLLHAKDLVKNGESLNQASIESGFNSYSSFYRAYIKEYDSLPKENL